MTQQPMPFVNSNPWDFGDGSGSGGSPLHQLGLMFGGPWAQAANAGKQFLAPYKDQSGALGFGARVFDGALGPSIDEIMANPSKEFLGQLLPFTKWFG